jgi:peptidoglycan hydrolase CwlO-like protein
MTILEKLKNVLWVILLSSIAFAGVIVLALQNGEIKTDIKTQNNIIDSLTHELYINNKQMDRMLNSLEYLKEKNPKAYNQYKQYHDNETE